MLCGIIGHIYWLNVKQEKFVRIVLSGYKYTALQLLRSRHIYRLIMHAFIYIHQLSKYSSKYSWPGLSLRYRQFSQNEVALVGFYKFARSFALFPSFIIARCPNHLRWVINYWCKDRTNNKKKYSLNPIGPRTSRYDRASSSYELLLYLCSGSLC